MLVLVIVVALLVGLAINWGSPRMVSSYVRLPIVFAFAGRPMPQSGTSDSVKLLYGGHYDENGYYVGGTVCDTLQIIPYAQAISQYASPAAKSTYVYGQVAKMITTNTYSIHIVTYYDSVTGSYLKTVIPWPQSVFFDDARTLPLILQLVRSGSVTYDQITVGDEWITPPTYALISI